MQLYQLVLICLSICGLTKLITSETGPYAIFERMRALSDGYNCNYCTSCQISLFICVLLALCGTGGISDYIVVVGLPQVMFRLVSWITAKVDIWMLK